MSELYANVTNGFARKSLIKNLGLAVVATTDAAKSSTNPPTNYVFLKADVVAKLVAADASLVQVGPLQADGTQAVQATAAGIAAIGTTPVVAATPVVHGPKIVVPAGGFEIETGVTLPAAKRASENASGLSAQFDKLEVGQSFFVPATDALPNPGKAIASTVSSNTRKHSKSNPVRVFTMRANVNKIEGDPTSPKGARVFRIEPKVAPSPAPVTTSPVQAPVGTTAVSPFPATV